jgi:hypothetical protein
MFSGSVWAKKISAPGSWVVKFIPLTLLAFFVSTIALYSRPDGLVISAWCSASQAA